MTDEIKEKLQGYFWPVVERLGFPTAIVGVLIFFGWSTAEWLKTDVAKPLIESHLVYLKKNTELMDQQAKAITELQMAVAQNAKLLRELHEKSISEERKRAGGL